MSGAQYDPEKHHQSSPRLRPAGRRSIRLKGHDYAGGGLYFVTICAHREFIAWAKGSPFGTTRMSPVRGIMEERLRITEDKFPDAQWKEWVIMPDHFHALIQMEGGGLRLGDVVGGFKSAVSRELRRAMRAVGNGAVGNGAVGNGAVGNGAVGRATRASPVRRGEACLAPFAGRIWLRNYYEIIVRSEEAERNIVGYIRMNPWRCVQNFASGLRGIGNPALWSGEKLGVLCSRNAPRIGRIPDADVYFGGWHSPKEQEILAWLLEQKKRVVSCPAWGTERARQTTAVLEALEDNRMLILEMRNAAGDLAAAEQRNRFVIKNADKLYVPHVTRGGMLDRLLAEQKTGVN